MSFVCGSGPSSVASVGELLDCATLTWGSKPGIHDIFGTLRFASIRDRVDSLAAELAARGLSRRSGLGLRTRNNREAVIAFFAALKCGAAVLPMPTTMKSSEVQEITELCGLHFVLDSADGAEHQLSRTDVDLSRMFAPHIADAALVRFSSGTTGLAKGVVLSHRSALERCAAIVRALELTSDDTVLFALPIAYHFAGSILPYIACGAAIAFTANDLDAASLLDCAKRYRATVLYASPLHIRLLARDTSGGALTTVRRVMSTGAAVSPETCRQFANRYGQGVCQLWGSAELGLPIVNIRRSEERPEAVGYAVDGFRVEVLDEDFRTTPAGSEGQLAIEGPGMFDGYVSPQLTRDDVLHDGWFLTGDLASRDDDGLITIRGRAKTVINVAGAKVFPEEVENVLLEHPAVRRCRVFGRAHPLVGECVVAEVELLDGVPVKTGELPAWCRSHLSAYKVPRVVKIVDEVRLTPAGKINRRLRHRGRAKE